MPKHAVWCIQWSAEVLVKKWWRRTATALGNWDNLMASKVYHGNLRDIVLRLWWDCCDIVVNLMWECCEIDVSLMCECCEIVVSLMWDCCEIVVSLISECCEIVVSLMWDCCELVNLLWTWCEIFVRFLWVWCEIVVNLMWDSCDLDVRMLWDCFEVVLSFLWDCSEFVVRLLWGSSFDGFIAQKNIPVFLAVLRHYFGAILWIKTPPTPHPHPRCSHYFWLRLNWIRLGILVRGIYVIKLRNSISTRDFKHNYLKARKGNKLSKHYVKRFRPVQPKT